VSVDGLDDARLRRAQALLPNTEHRLPVARELIEAKIKGQLAVIDSFTLPNTGEIQRSLVRLATAKQIDGALIAEGKAAEAYWDAWATVPVEFAKRDLVPDHWRVFGRRRSPFTLRPRNAASPLNAILNYLYTLLEIETRVALSARGLDCGLGIFHADQANRQSLAADVMEPVRPHVDAFVLNLARTRTFSVRDFAETREGGCRLSLGLAHDLAQTMARWAKLVAPYAEGVGRHVARFAKVGAGVTAPMGPMPSADRVRIKVRAAAIPPVAPPSAVRSLPASVASNACRGCGAKVTVRKRVYCDACLPTQMAAQQSMVEPTFVAAGPAKLAAMRAAGHDPTATPEAQKRRAKSASKQRNAVTAWRDDGSLDDINFRRDILPQLQSLLVRVIADAMGTTISHASKVRGGKLVPHKRHWNALRHLMQNRD
jgi:hypothetical protein